MADTSITFQGNGSPQAVALRLFEIIAKTEGKPLEHGKTGAPDTDWILNTYWRCLRTTQGLQPPNT